MAGTPPTRASGLSGPARYSRPTHSKPQPPSQEGQARASKPPSASAWASISRSALSPVPASVSPAPLRQGLPPKARPRSPRMPRRSWRRKARLTPRPTQRHRVPHMPRRKQRRRAQAMPRPARRRIPPRLRQHMPLPPPPRMPHRALRPMPRPPQPLMRLPVLRHMLHRVLRRPCLGPVRSGREIRSCADE